MSGDPGHPGSRGISRGEKKIKLTAVGYWGAYPEKGEATSGYLLQANGFSLLLECGSGVLSLLPGYVDLQRLAAVVVSHYHGDHIADIGCLQYAVKVQIDLGLRKDTLPVYGPAGDERSPLAYHDYTRGIFVDPSAATEIGPFTFRFQRTNHPVLCYAMRIESQGKTIVYTADTGWYDELVEFAGGADLLLCEASLYNRYYGLVEGHMSTAEVGRLASMAGVKKLVLTHLPHFGDHGELLSEVREEFAGAAELAASGKKWVL